jgi:hypothetical protein
MTVTLVQDFVDPFNYYGYTYSFNFANGVQTEDEINDIEVVDIINNEITITFRSEDWYNYVSSCYVANNWYVITPLPNSLYPLLSSTGIAQADLYYFTAPIGLTFIARNQAEQVKVFNGTWSDDSASMYTMKLLCTA